MPKKSICDRCYEPGACCKSILIHKGGNSTPFTSWLSDTPAEVKSNLSEFMKNTVDAEHAGNFEFDRFEGTHIDKLTKESYATVRLRCTKLLPGGRCGIYADRPSMCRTYQPREDQMCVHFTGAESGDPTVPLTQEPTAHA